MDALREQLNGKVGESHLADLASLEAVWRAQTQRQDVVFVRSENAKLASAVTAELCRLLQSQGPSRHFQWQALLLVATRQRVLQAAAELSALYEALGAKCTSLLGEGKQLREAALQAGQLVVTTPGRLREALKLGIIRPQLWEQQAGRPGMASLVIEAADTMVAMPGYKDDLEALSSLLASSTQRIVRVATHTPPSADSWLTQQFVRTSQEPLVIDASTLHQGLDSQAQSTSGAGNDGPTGIVEGHALQSHSMACPRQDKLLVAMALLKLGALRKKAVLFTTAASFAVRLKLMLGAFGLRAAVLLGTLPRNTRRRIVQEFNAAVLDYLVISDCAIPHIASPGTTADDDDEASASEDDETGLDADEELVPQTDDQSQRSTKRKRVEVQNKQKGLRSVKSVLHVDVPSAEGRAGRIACLASTTPADAVEVALVPSASEAQEPAGGWAHALPSFAGAPKEAIEKLRYRAEDVARSLNPSIVKQARARDLQHELLSSKKLQEHFRLHPGDLTVLKSAMPRAKAATEPASHLRHLPGYLKAGGQQQRRGGTGKQGAGKKVYVSPFGPKASSKKRRKGGDASEELTEMEKAAMKSAPKRPKKDGSYIPKRNVRKGKTRKR
ncbi:hypothetical protein WJX73_005658 [Symbiochloris irregularis]|uniref:ATP-dependent RNA helicase n=1 Tax=Symbiochloris irregularis TaxID=706552 RepID=A0AAW1P7A6_9CHLO